MMSPEPYRYDENGPTTTGVPGEGSLKSLSPEESLWACVLAQAKDDYLKFADTQSASGRCLHDEVSLWLHSTSTDPGAFRWVCELIGVEPGYVLRSIEERRRLAA